jgi:PPOX class probable FMN-dependent enzyme
VPRRRAVEREETGMPADGNGGASRFKDVVTSVEQLREVLGDPGHYAAQKVVPILDEHCARFIAASPFIMLATANARGEPDVSPKGDPAGFVKILDERTMAIPDRPGNNRIDSFRNIVENPSVAVIFVVPGVRHTLRVCGKGQIVRDPELRAAMAINGKAPGHVLVVSVERALFHCPKCMIRSHLWDPEAWPETSNVPTLAQTLVAHAELAERVADVERMVVADSKENLY